MCAHYVLNHGTEEQKHRWLPRLASGELVGAICMTEPGTGSDLKGIRTRAVKKGDHYVVDGGKTFITNGWLAGLLMLVVRTDAEDRSRGLSIVMVETQDLPGYRVGRVLDKMGLHGQDTSELFFEGVKVRGESAGRCRRQGHAKLMHDHRTAYRDRSGRRGRHGRQHRAAQEVRASARPQASRCGTTRTRDSTGRARQRRARGACFRIAASWTWSQRARYRDGIDGQVVDLRHAAESPR
jgi:hypothetical protein